MKQQEHNLQVYNELWKDISGYEGLYQVSNLGRVKSLPKKISCRNGFRYSKEKILKPLKKTYQHIQLGKKGKYLLIHRLVAEAFIANLENKPQVNHIDGNKHNNHLENLEWVTQSENQRHAYKIGLQKPFSLKLEKSPKARKIEVFSTNGDKLYDFDCIKKCAIVLKLRYNSIMRVLYGKRNKYHNLIFKYETH